MPTQHDKKLSDAELDRLARELFAEVRAQHREDPLNRPAGEATSNAGVDLLDWLLDASDGDGDSGD